MSAWRLLPAALSGLLLALPPAGAEPAGLRFDPFRRPTPKPVVRPAPAAQPAPTRHWLPELRAVIRAGAHSVADIDGELYRLGDRFEDHRIAEVGDRSVTLRGIRNGHTHVLRLSDSREKSR